MSGRMFRRLHAGALLRGLAIAAIFIAALTVPARTGAVVAAGPDDRAAGPSDWADDLSPIAAADWSAARAAHLIERAGFGATPEEVARLAAMTPRQVVDALVDYESIDSGLKPFDESGIWDPGMDPFPPSRAEAVRLARAHGEALGVKVLPPGSQRRLQGVVDKFFYSLAANNIETAASRPVVGEPHADDQASARGEADALLARPFRDRREQGARLPDDAQAERDVPRARVREPPRSAGRRS